MANSIVEKIAAYRAAKLGQNGESHEKCEIVEWLEDYLAESTVLDFYLDLIVDMEDYDLARVGAFKILGFWDPSNELISERIGRQIASALLRETDILVQQWAAIALRITSVSPRYLRRYRR